jgi:hypothetical protein
MKLCLALLLSIAGTIPAAAQTQPQGQAQQSVPPAGTGQPDEYYTLEDINAMIAFYESPVGQKTLQNQTKIAVEALQAFMPVVMKLTKQAEDEVKKEHPELVPGNGDSPSR